MVRGFDSEERLSWRYYEFKWLSLSHLLISSNNYPDDKQRCGARTESRVIAILFFFQRAAPMPECMHQTERKSVFFLFSPGIGRSSLIGSQAFRYVYLTQVFKLHYLWRKGTQRKSTNKMLPNGTWTQVRNLNTLSSFQSESESCSVMSDSLRPHGLYSPWNSPAQNTGVGSLSLLQGIFPTQGSNLGLPHCRWIPYQLSHRGAHSPFKFTVSNLYETSM